MKITFRLMVSLVIVVAIVTAIFSFYQVNKEKSRMTVDLDRRAAILADSLKESVTSPEGAELPDWLNRLVVKYERFEGVALFGLDGKIITATAELKPMTPQPFPAAVKTILKNRPSGEFMDINGKETYVYVLPLKADGKITGAMALFNDATYIGVRLSEIWKYNLLRFLIYTLLIVLITVVVVRWSITGPIAQVAQWMREASTGKGKLGQPVQFSRGDILSSLINEATNLAKSLAVARTKADEVARGRFNAASLWTAGRLRDQMRVELSGKKLFLVSNR